MKIFIFTSILVVMGKAGQPGRASSYKKGRSDGIKHPFTLVSICSQLSRTLSRKVDCRSYWGRVSQYDVEEDERRLMMQCIPLWILYILRKVTKFMKIQIYLNCHCKIRGLKVEPRNNTIQNDAAWRRPVEENRVSDMVTGIHWHFMCSEHW